MKKFFKKQSTKLKKLWKTRRWLLITILVVLLLAGKQLSSRAANQQELVFISPTVQDLTKTLEVSGIIDAKEKASLKFLAGGKVVYLGAKEGEAVKKWQTIAQIDAASLAKTKEKSLNLYSKERLDWDQQLDDVEDRAIDQEENRTVDKNQLDLQNTVLDLEIAAIAVGNTVMSSPINGILVQSPTNVAGVQLAATDAFIVVNPATLIFRALVDEADIAAVQQNQTATIELDAYPTESIASFINYIAYISSSSSTGTAFAVELPITNDSGLQKYRLGMNGDVNIILEEKSAVLTIPLIAIRQRASENYVDVRINDQETEERLITTGLETDEYVEVLSGLTETDQILMPE